MDLALIKGLFILSCSPDVAFSGEIRVAGIQFICDVNRDSVLDSITIIPVPEI